MDHPKYKIAALNSAGEAKFTLSADDLAGALNAVKLIRAAGNSARIRRYEAQVAHEKIFRA